MNEDTQHKLTARLGGISGYRPAICCAVCGYKAHNNTAKKCVGEKCPNYCHVNCLGESSNFSCDNTVQLRVEAGILHPVVYTPGSFTGSTDIPSEPESDDETVLDNISNDQLKKIVREYRKEYKETNEQLSVFGKIVTNLPEKKSVLLFCLEISDTLIAT